MYMLVQSIYIYIYIHMYSLICFLSLPALAQLQESIALPLLAKLISNVSAMTEFASHLLPNQSIALNSPRDLRSQGEAKGVIRVALAQIRRRAGQRTGRHR